MSYGEVVDISNLGVTGQQIRKWLEGSNPINLSFYGNSEISHFTRSYGPACRLVLPEHISMEETSSVVFAGTFADSNDEVTILKFIAKGTNSNPESFTCKCGEFEAESVSYETTISEAITSILKASGIVDEEVTVW